MKYQVLKGLKTKNKLIKLCDSLKEAHEVLKSIGAKFVELSYIGQFPVYTDGKNTYNIQGLHTGYNIVLGLDKAELETFNFNL